MRIGSLLACLTLLASCGEAVKVDEPRKVRVDEIAADQICTAILDECHRPLRGRMDHVVATLTFADGKMVQVFGELPDRVRVQFVEHYLLLRDDRVFRLDGLPVSTREEQMVRSLALMLDATAFGPLHREAHCERTGDHEFRITTREGHTWQLRLRPDTLLPASLTCSGHEIQFDDYLRTKTTWVVNAATMADLGSCKLVFDDGGFVWQAEVFDPDAALALDPGSGDPAQGDQADRQDGQRYVDPGAIVQSRPTTPEFFDGKAASWVILDDPGTWSERSRIYAGVCAELERQDQMIFGFPLFFTEADKGLIAAPFRQRPAGQALQPPADWRIREIPAARWLVVYPSGGSFADKSTSGWRLLERALEQQHLTAIGPMTAQPFLHLEDGEASTEKLADPVVRCAVRIE